MDAPMWKVAVEEFVKDENSLSASDIASALTKGEEPVSLLEFVESLGEYLTSTETTVRCRVVKLLSNVLHLLPNDYLSTSEGQLMVGYLCDRLKDHHTIQPPALHGLLALCGSKTLADGCAEKICRAIFSEVQNQTLSQHDRGNVYSILTLLLSTKLQELQQMGPDFVLGYIQAMDAEKDPRNLIMAFRCARRIILNFSLGVFTEEMFEVVSCYFPIDFTPPPDDPYGITREDLIVGLRGCLSASSQFGQFCYPLLLEKLTSDIQSAKIDSLQTLTACAEVYGLKSLVEYQSSFFSCIKREVFGSENQVLDHVALTALTSVVSTLSQETVITEGKSCLEEFIEEVLTECSRHLDDTNLRLMNPTCRLLLAAAAGSDSACKSIVSKLLPRLVQIYYSHSMVKERLVTLGSLQGLLKTAGKFSNTVLDVLKEHKTSLLGILMSAMSESSIEVRLAATQCLTACLQLPGVLTSEFTVAELIMDRVFKDEDENVRSECVVALSTLAKVDTDLFREKILPQIVAQLQTKSMEVDGVPACNHGMVYSILAAVTVSKDVLSMVLSQLFSYLSITAKLTSSSDNSKELPSIVQCLTSIAENCVVDHDMLTVLYKETLPEIFSMFVCMATNPAHCDSCLHNQEVIECVSSCIRIIVSSLDMKRISELCSQISSLYLNGDVAYLKVLPGNSFKPLDLSSPWQQTELIAMVSPVICCCCKEDLHLHGKLFLPKLLVLSLQSDHTFTRKVSTMCLAGLLNRWQHEDLNSHLQNNLENIKEILSQSDVCKRKAALNNLVWVTKALALRGHLHTKDYMTLLLGLLEDSELGVLAADGFDTVLSDDCSLLSRKTKATVKMLYKQRLFAENLNKLTEGFHKSTQGVKKNYLIALSHLLKVQTKQVLLTELPPLFPLVVQSLFCEDIDLQLSTMSTLYNLTHEAPAVISKHIDSIIPQLLKMCSCQQSMKVRRKAAECIGVLTVLPEHLLLPYQKQVVRALEPVLDDKKRLVRKEAVKARGEWFLVGASNV